MIAQNSSCNSRPLGNFEKQYVDWQMKRQYAALKWVMGGLSGFLILFSVALPVAFSLDNSHLAPEKFFVLILFCVVFFGLGVFLARTTRRRKLTCDDQASRIAGVLVCKTARVVNPRTGGSTEVKRYLIGDMQVCFPPGCETLLTPYVDQPIDVVAATYSISNPIAFFGGKSTFDESQTTALILELYDKINVQRAMEKYGAGLFKAQFHRMVTMGLAGGLLLFWGVFHLIENVDPEQITLATIGMGIFALLVLSFILALIYTKIMALLGITPYLEKVKG